MSPKKKSNRTKSASKVDQNNVNKKIAKSDNQIFNNFLESISREINAKTINDTEHDELKEFLRTLNADVKVLAYGC